jgi:sarcosine oxidase subunit beta
VQTCDVVIIGGGAVGASIAYSLAKRGTDVLVLERGMLGNEASGRNTGTLTVLTERLTKVNEAPLRSIALTRWMRLSSELDYDLEVNLGLGTLVVAENEMEAQALPPLKAAYEEKGLSLRLLQAAELRAFAPYLSNHVLSGLYCALGGKANPRQVAWAYARAAKKCGARVKEGVAACGLVAEQDGTYTISTSEDSVRARSVVLAAGPWTSLLARPLGVELPLRINYFQASVTTAVAPMLPHLLRRMSGQLTLKQASQGNLILGGGWCGASAFPQHGRILLDAVASNCAVAARLVPALAELSLLRTWAGYDGSSIDSYPVIDEIPGWPNVFVSTGSSGGFTLSPVLGDMTAAVVLREPSPFDVSSLSLARFPGAVRGDSHARSDELVTW